MAPLVRTGGSRHTGLAALPHRNIQNAWYFRNALVRANYANLQKGIHETTEYLEAFLRNLLLNEKNELHNQNLHIRGLLNEEKVDIGNGKVDIQDKKWILKVYFPKKVVISQ